MIYSLNTAQVVLLQISYHVFPTYHSSWPMDVAEFELEIVAPLTDLAECTERSILPLGMGDRYIVHQSIVLLVHAIDILACAIHESLAHGILASLLTQHGTETVNRDLGEPRTSG